jgi:hypothetical protein
MFVLTIYAVYYIYYNYNPLTLKVKESNQKVEESYQGESYMGEVNEEVYDESNDKEKICVRKRDIIDFFNIKPWDHNRDDVKCSKEDIKFWCSLADSP